MRASPTAAAMVPTPVVRNPSAHPAPMIPTTMIQSPGRPKGTTRRPATEDTRKTTTARTCMTGSHNLPGLRVDRQALTHQRFVHTITAVLPDRAPPWPRLLSRDLRAVSQVITRRRQVGSRPAVATFRLARCSIGWDKLDPPSLTPCTGVRDHSRLKGAGVRRSSAYAALALGVGACHYDAFVPSTAPPVYAVQELGLLSGG